MLKVNWIVAGALIFSGCASKTQTGALAGGIGGAAVGGAIGGGQGALIGGAVGVIGGALIGSALDSQDREYMEKNHARTMRHIDEGKQLSEQDIINMSDANIKDETIIELIRKTNSHYNLDANDVIRLRKSGVSERVIDYMISN